MPKPVEAPMPRLIASAVSRWWDDPYARGAWSLLRPGSTPDTRATLGRPIGHRLIIAGEATHPQQAGMVHGAFEEGQRAARWVREMGHHSAIVIGAGAAGIGAARMLAETGITPIVIEARERIGGRVRTTHLDGTTAELGANWLQQASRNPLVNIASAAGLETRRTNFARPIELWPSVPVAGNGTEPRRDTDRGLDRQVAGEPVSGPMSGGESGPKSGHGAGKALDRRSYLRTAEEPVSGHESWLASVQRSRAPADGRADRKSGRGLDDELDSEPMGSGDAGAASGQDPAATHDFDAELAARIDRSAVTDSVATLMRSWTQDDGRDPAKRRAIERFMAREVYLDAGAPLDDISARFGIEAGVGDGDVFLPAGYLELLAYLTEGLSITLGFEAQRIVSTDEGVTVTATDGRSVQADAVIVTIPAAVLRHHADLFEPPLPSTHLDALDGLTVGRVEKAALAFEKRWWPTDANGYLRIGSADAGDALSISEWLDLTDVAGRPMLVGLMVGPWVEHIWSHTDDAVVAALVAQELYRAVASSAASI